MANSNSFNGNRFLVDAKNSRQYVVPFVHGEPRKPIQMFAENRRDDEFMPGETILAFDEAKEQELKSVGVFQTTLSTVIYQLKADAAGKSVTLAALCPVTYDLRYQRNSADKPIISYALTKDSFNDLQSVGIDAGAYAAFEIRCRPLAHVDVAALARSVPFPSHHKKGASIAHANVDAVAPAAVAASAAATEEKFTLSDEDTISTVQKIPGMTLTTVFNFALMTQTQIVEKNGHLAVSTTGFHDVDSLVVEKMWEKLATLGGKAESPVHHLPKQAILERK